MDISLRNGISILFTTFISIFLVGVMNYQMQIVKVNDYHYALVNEIESSDFSTTVINEATSNEDYDVKIENRGVKDDLRIYQVTTSKEITMPLLGVVKTYIKESAAR